MQIIFGPVLSRRFGVSLGVDLSPLAKQCNFNCVYCELEAKKAVDSQSQVVPPEAILQAITEALRTHTDIAVLTFTANGEPTLYPHLETLILQTKELIKQYPNVKTLILSNGSLFQEKAHILQHFDMVKFSLDSAAQTPFKRVDQPSKTLDLEHIKQGIQEFSQQYSGELIAEVLVVKDINDDEQSNKETAAFLRTLKIHRLDLSTIDRPSSHRVFPVSNERLYELSELYHGMRVCVATRKQDGQDSCATSLAKRELNEIELLELLKRRPLTHADCAILLSENSLQNLESLCAQGQVQIHNIAGVEFYCVGRERA